MTAIGLARGAVVVGLASTSQRTAYACIGAPMLRAAQLASDALQRSLESVGLWVGPALKLERGSA